jgi:U2 small nuclear ribonucleoprotein B''
MAEVSASPAPDAMQDVVSSTPTEPTAPEEPEYISETLYIQNLNEKIKIDGIIICAICGWALLIFCATSP